MQNNISTDRLLLDILTKSDWAFIIELLNTKGWIEFIGDRNIHSEEDALAYIDKIIAAPNIYYWVVRLKDENVPVGIISFIKRDYLENFDIGFAFLPEFNGQGYAYEAANEVLSVVRKNPEHPIVLATTIPRNLNSIKLLLKLGLHFEKEIETGNDQLHIYTTADS